MKALQTQFDNKRLSNAVATPTCSSCCCCCCCLATSVAASSLLAQRIRKEGAKHQVPNRHLLTVLAAFFMPVVGVLAYFGFWPINRFLNQLLSTCTEHSYSDRAYTVCTKPGALAIGPLLLIVSFLVLWFLYTQVRIEKPVKRAALVTVLIAIAFTAELFAGANLIHTGVGGIAYLIMIPIIVGWISAWYYRHIGKDVDNSPASSIQPAYPTEQPTEHNEEDSTKQQEPPQQNPPAPGP